MKIAAFSHVSEPYTGGVAIISPNWNKFSEKKESGKWFEPFRWRPARGHIPDFRFWSIGEATKGPGLVGKRFRMHDMCEEPYCWDIYFRQRKPEKIRLEYRDQLDEMTAIMGDRPYLILDDSRLPPRRWPWSTRRNAWAIDGNRIVDRREIITKQEVALTLMWMHKVFVDDGGMWTERLRRIIQSDGRRYLLPGEIEPRVAEWRRSHDCWPESRFDQPRNARFDLRLYQEAA